MFDALSDKLQATLGDVRQRGALTEDDVKATMREIRLALLEADVNFAVVREFTSAVREKALGEEVLKRVDPGQQVVKIVSDELTELMGGAGADLALSPRKPTIVVLAGLQGSGKTTAAAKLARMLREEKGLDVAVAACDVYRPAAVEQLIKVGGRGEKVMPAEDPPMRAASSSLTILTTCWPGLSWRWTSTPCARSLTAEVNCLTTLKLTSASSSARRISRMARAMSSSVSAPRWRTPASVPWSFSESESNMLLIG